MRPLNSLLDTLPITKAKIQHLDKYSYKTKLGNTEKGMR